MPRLSGCVAHTSENGGTRWQRRRRWKKRGLFLLYWLFLTLLLRQILAKGLPLIDTEQLTQYLTTKADDALKLLQSFAPLGDIPLKKWHWTVPLFGGFLASGLLFRGKGSLGGDQMVDRLFGQFDDDTLQPIGYAAPSTDLVQPFVRLDWQIDSEGPRAEAWESLLDWTGRADRRRSSYAIAVLVGRAGSGKSRMAAELARSLGQRSVLGDARHHDLSRANWRREADRVIFGGLSWFRRVVPMIDSSRRDPWDAGVLRHQVGIENTDQFLARLARWYPRRATLLVLDDPLPGQTGEIHRVLSNASAGYHHPVRLLVANQTLPLDGPLRYESLQKGWHVDGAPADPPPVTLPAESWFSERRTREVAFATEIARQASEPAKREIRDGLFALTKGNPLLIELALEAVRGGASLASISVELLPRERARRIVAALKGSGIDGPGQFAALVLATLVVGAREDQLREALDRSGLFAGRDTTLPPLDQLRACFPADSLSISDGEAVIPPVRPELIATAFVNVVVEDQEWATTPDGKLAKLVEQAFRLNPKAMLRQMRRIPSGSALQSVLTALDLSKLVGPEPLEWAEAWCDLAIWVDIDAGDWSHAEQDGREAQACAAIRRLEPADRETLIHRLASAMVGDPAERPRIVAQHPVLFKLVHVAAEDAGLTLDIGFWTAFYESCEELTNHSVTACPNDGPLRAIDASAGNEQARYRFFRALLNLVNANGHFVAPLVRRLQSGTGNPGCELRELVYQAAAGICVKDAGLGGAEYLERVLEIGCRFAESRDEQTAEYGLALSFPANHVIIGQSAVNLAAAWRAIEAIAELAKRAPDDQELALIEAMALRDLSYAIGMSGQEDRLQHLVLCLKAIRALQARTAASTPIAASLTAAISDLLFAAERCNVHDVAELVSECLDLALGLVEQFPNCRRCAGSAFLAINNAFCGPGLQNALQSLGDDPLLAFDRMQSRFPSSLLVNFRAAHCLRGVADRAVRNFGITNPERSSPGIVLALECVGRAESLIHNFPADCGIAEQAGAVLSLATQNLVKVIGSNETGTIRRLRGELETSQTRHPGSTMLQAILGEAYVSESEAWANLAGKVGSAGCAQVFERAAALAAVWPANTSVQTSFAGVISNACMCHAGLGGIEGIDQVDAMIRRSADLSDTWPDNDQIKFELLRCLTTKSYKLSNLVGERHAESCDDASLRAHELALERIDEPEVALHGARVLCNAAWALSQSAGTDNLARIESRTSALRAYQECHPDHAEIQAIYGRSLFNCIRAHHLRGDPERAKELVASLAEHTLRHNKIAELHERLAECRAMVGLA